MSRIFVRGLRVSTCIGVPDEERATPQEVELDLEITPTARFETLGDDIAGTIDYAAVVTRVEALAGAEPRRLVEVLARDVAETVLREFGAASVTVEVRKFILPQTRCVGVSFTAEGPRVGGL